jgi:hypothetical protein
MCCVFTLHGGMVKGEGMSTRRRLPKRLLQCLTGWCLLQVFQETGSLA